MSHLDSPNTEMARIADALSQLAADFRFVVDVVRPALEDVAEDVEDIALQDLVEVPQ